MVKNVKDILLDDFWIMPATPEYLEAGVPYITSKNIKNGKIDFGKVNYISQEAYETISRNRPIVEGDILISMIGTLGETAEVTKEDGTFYGQNMFLIRINETEINKRYFLNFFKSDYVKRELARKQNQSTQKYLKANHIEDLQISVLPLDEQQIIAETLDKIQKIINNRKEELLRLDNLIKARFVELFGDPIRNTQNRPTTDFINVVKMQRGFDLPVQDRQQDGNIPVFGSNGALDRHNVAKVQHGGVITGRSGTIGKVYYTEGDYWPLNTSLFSVDTHGNNIIYLAYLLQMYDLSRFTEGTGVPTLNRNKFHDKPIIDVPLDEQKLFAAFVEQTDKSKVVWQKVIKIIYDPYEKIHRTPRRNAKWQILNF